MDDPFPMAYLTKLSDMQLANDLEAQFKLCPTDYDDIETAAEFIDRLFKDIATRHKEYFSQGNMEYIIQEVSIRFNINLATIRNSKDQNQTLLHTLAGYGHKKWVYNLVMHQEADVNARNDKGQTPLHAACNHAHKSIAKLLIERGAHVNIQDNEGWTPLHFALIRSENANVIQPRYWEVVELLLENGANPYLRTKTKSRSCLNLITNDDQRRAVRVKHVLSALKSCDPGSPISPEDIIDKYLRVTDFFELVKIGDEDDEMISILQQLFTKRLLNSRLETCDNITPLHRAAGHNHLKVAKLLIDAGADVNSTDAHGRIPLHNAARYGHIGMIELLVREGSDINKQDLEGSTPIHIAAEHTTFPACRKLVELGANVGIRTATGQLPVDYAESDDVKEVLSSGSQRVKLIPSTSEQQAVYISFQDYGITRPIREPCQQFNSIQDSLMLDSSSDARLFSNPDHQIKKIILAEDDPRYILVKEKMLETIVFHANDVGGRFDDYEIISIEYILHEKVWSKYRLACQKLEIDYGPGSKNEKLLFHGSNFIDGIQNTGFDERYAHGDGMFGAGIYFADHSSKSNQYAFGFGSGCSAHSNKSCFLCERKMIYAQVALGRTLKSKTAMNDYPHGPPGYSSVAGVPQITEGLLYPEYAIYSGDQAYPLFVITYRIRLRSQ